MGGETSFLVAGGTGWGCWVIAVIAMSTIVVASMATLMANEAIMTSKLALTILADKRASAAVYKGGKFQGPGLMKYA